ncbi:MAG: 2-hydroxyacid dehydrogenase [Candidatus Peregrinibacteria bacterium]
MNRFAFLEVDSEDDARILKQFPEAVIFRGPLADDGTLDRLTECEALCCFIYSKIGEAELAKMPKLKLIATRSVGFDHINMDACRKRGIIVCNVPDYGSHVIAEHVFALLLSTFRHIAKADKLVREGTFDYHKLRGIALRGKTLGILGTGKIGRKVAQIGKGFGMHLRAVDKCRILELEDILAVKYKSLDEVIAESDIITLHLPALPETEHIINDASIAKMKDGVIIVNTARGSLIDSHALLRGLNSGKIQYALLDVLEHEKNFEENRALIEHPSVVTTPHIAFYADDSMRDMFVDSFESIQQWMEGKTPERLVKPPAMVCDLPGVSKVSS